MEDNTLTLVKSRNASHKESKKINSGKTTHQGHRKKKKKKRTLCRCLRSPHLHAVLDGVPVIISVSEIGYFKDNSNDNENELAEAYEEKVSTACSPTDRVQDNISQTLDYTSLKKNEMGDVPYNNGGIKDVQEQGEDISNALTANEIKTGAIETFTGFINASNVNLNYYEHLDGSLEPVFYKFRDSSNTEDYVTKHQLDTISKKISNLEEELVGLKESIIYQELKTETKFASIQTELSKISKSLPLIKYLVTRKQEQRKNNNSRLKSSNKQKIKSQLTSRQSSMKETIHDNASGSKLAEHPFNEAEEKLYGVSASGSKLAEHPFNEAEEKLNDVRLETNDNYEYGDVPRQAHYKRTSEDKKMNVEVSILFTERTWRDAVQCLYTPESVYEPSTQSLQRGDEQYPSESPCRIPLPDVETAKNPHEPKVISTRRDHSDNLQICEVENINNQSSYNGIALKKKKGKRNKVKTKKKSTRKLVRNEDADNPDLPTIVVRLALSSEKALCDACIHLLSE